MMWKNESDLVLTPEEEQVSQLREDGLSFREIALKCGLPTQYTASSRYKRAQAKLRELRRREFHDQQMQKEFTVTLTVAESIIIRRIMIWFQQYKEKNLRKYIDLQTEDTEYQVSKALYQRLYSAEQEKLVK